MARSALRPHHCARRVPPVVDGDDRPPESAERIERCGHEPAGTDRMVMRHLSIAPVVDSAGRFVGAVPTTSSLRQAYALG